jgi:hypothetical protein
VSAAKGIRKVCCFRCRLILNEKMTKRQQANLFGDITSTLMGTRRWTSTSAAAGGCLTMSLYTSLSFRLKAMAEQVGVILYICERGRSSEAAEPA